MKNSKSLVFKVFISLMFTLCATPSAQAGGALLRWLLSLIPQGQYGAIVAAESTGGGKVYVENSQDSQTTGANESIGAKSTNFPNAEVSFYLKAIPGNGYYFDFWDDTQPASEPHISNDPSYTETFRTSFTAATDDDANAAEYQRFAYFTPIPYTLSFNADGGSANAPADIDYDIERSILMPGYSGTKDGYTFSGWKPSSNVGNWHTYDSYSAGRSYSGKYGDVVLNALWSAKSYTVTYNANGGSVTPYGTSQNYNINSSATVKSANKSYSTFSGWKVTKVDTEGNWTLNQKISAGTPLLGKFGNVTLTALWDVKLCDITISLTGMDAGDSGIFTVSEGGTVLYTVAVQSGSSITIKDLEQGTITVAPTSWSWVYSGLTTQTDNVDVSNYTFTFAATKNADVKKHEEKSEVNWGD